MQFVKNKVKNFFRILSAAFDTSALGLTLFPISGDFCHLLITFANSLDPDQARQNVRPDQARQNVGPDLDPNCLTLRWYS